MSTASPANPRVAYAGAYQHFEEMASRGEINATPLPPLAGSKRKSYDAADTENVPPVNDYDSDDDDSREILDYEPCDAIRKKITTFIESGEMGVGQFCDAIGVGGNSYRRFMNQGGKDKKGYERVGRVMPTLAP